MNIVIPDDYQQVLQGLRCFSLLQDFEVQLYHDHCADIDTLALTGYQAGGTRGAKLQQGVDSVKIHGEWVQNRAQIQTLHGLSGHGDYVDIGHWLERSALEPDTRIQLVHGDPDALEGMRDHLRKTLPFEVAVAGYRHILTV